MTLPAPKPTAPAEPGGTQNTEPTAGARPPRGRGSRRRAGGPRRPLPATIALYVLVAFTFAVFAVPIYWLFSSALKPENEIYTFPLTWLPSELAWQNFAEAWTSAPFGAFLKNSIITTVAGTALEIGVALLSAYAFAFVYFRGKMLVFAVMVG